ncbi:HDIG domain-containing protein [Patescibacteria group bacterium]|nr:HDIG domain-containing protein [Patescibacteria group bacterium]
MTREQTLQLVKEKIQSQNLIKHCLAVEAMMKAIAKHLNQDIESWSQAGLLHDIDYEETKDNPEEHSLKGAEMLKELGLTEEIVQAVKVHNEMHNLPRQSLMDKTLFAVDPLTGLITAAVLVLPSRKLADLSPESILKRFKEPRFAAGANRQAIKSIEDINVSLEEFIKIGLTAMQNIADDLGL